MRHRQAFTLVELSVVLVILGLILGGVLAGASMLRAQKVRNVLVDAKLYATAIQQFSDKYGALPGDFPDAERVWGNASGGDVNTNCGAPASTQSPDGIKTCNGNGTGFIDGSTEPYWAWQQLKAGGYIAGSYTGITGSASSNDAVPGSNIPAGTLTGTGFYLWSWGGFISDGTFFSGDYNNVMVFGGRRSGSWPTAAALSGGETLEMDKKADDGRPGTGSIRTFTSSWMNANSGNCTSSDDPATARYIATNDDSTCIALFMSSFNRAPAQ